MYNWAAEEEWQKMQQKNTFKDKRKRVSQNEHSNLKREGHTTFLGKVIYKRNKRYILEEVNTTLF